MSETQNSGIRVGEPTESPDAKIIRAYDAAVTAECFVHARQCNMRTGSKPGKGCDCQLGKLKEAIEAVREKPVEREEAPAPPRPTPATPVAKGRDELTSNKRK